MDDKVFAAYRRFFTYEPADVKAVDIARDDAPKWRIETVTYATAYTGEQVRARVFIPKNASPPFQAVVYVTGAGQFALRRSTNDTNLPQFAHVVRSGRLVVFPILKGAFERGSSQSLPETSKNGTLWRDYSVAWHKDIARTIDYLQARPDVAHDRIGYLGQSRGAAIAPHHAGAGPSDQGRGAGDSRVLPGAPRAGSGCLQLRAAGATADPDAERTLRLHFSREAVSASVFRPSRDAGA